MTANRGRVKQMTWKLLLTLYPILGLDQLIKTLKMKAFIPSAQIPVWAYFAQDFSHEMSTVPQKRIVVTKLQIETITNILFLQYMRGKCIMSTVSMVDFVFS